MLPFLRKNLPSVQRRHRFLLKTIALSAGIHGILALVFIISNSFFSVHTIVMRKGVMANNAPLLLIPLARRVGADTKKSMPSAKKRTPAVAYSVKKTEPKKKPVQKTVPETKSSTTVAKKSEAKPMVAVKKPAQQVKKPEVKPTVVAQKIVETPPVIELAQEVIVEVGRDELQEIQQYASIYACVEKEWRPPVGIPLTSECEIAFVINNEGHAGDISIARSSSIVMYDTAARLAVARAAFEPYTWGKRCAIVFKI